MEKTLNLIKNDPWLEPYAEAITGRHEYAMYKEAELTNGGKQTLSDFASGYLYFGLHRTDKGWTFREWAPNATHIYMVGTFNNWEEKEKYSLMPFSTVIFINWLYIGKADKENVFLLGLREWFKMKTQRSSVHRFGIRKSLLSLRKKHLNLLLILC